MIRNHPDIYPEAGRHDCTEKVLIDDITELVPHLDAKALRKMRKKALANDALAVISHQVAHSILI